MISAPFAPLHAVPDQPAESDRSKQLQIEVLLPGFVADIFECHRARRSGVVDEHVDLAEIGNDLMMGLGDGLGLGYVADVIAHDESVLGERFARELQIGCSACEDCYART